MALASRFRLQRSLPELSWPDFNDQVFAELLETVCQGKSRLEEAERTDLVPYLQSRLTPAQNRELQESAPQIALVAERTRLARLAYEPGPAADPVRASSRAIRLDRDAAARPRAGAGVVAHSRPKQSPRADHRRPEELLDHHLPPGAARTSAADIPKHAWPEDPFEGRPTSFPRRS